MSFGSQKFFSCFLSYVRHTHSMQQRFGFIALFSVLMLGLSCNTEAGWWPFQQKTPLVTTQQPLSQQNAGIDLVQQPAPDYIFHQLDLADKTQSPADWRGQTVFLNFFASWCVPCRAEHPVLLKLHTSTSALMIGVGHMDRVEDTQKILATLGNPYSLALEDKTGKGGKSWGVKGVPESFIINDKGIVVWNHRGPITEKIMTDEILPLLPMIKH
jgi:cytochrome c biogenesis protein CcmG/thiol:disulfide interchange protein DsbE